MSRLLDDELVEDIFFFLHKRVKDDTLNIGFSILYLLLLKIQASRTFELIESVCHPIQEGNLSPLSALTILAFYYKEIEGLDYGEKVPIYDLYLDKVEILLKNHALDHDRLKFGTLSFLNSVNWTPKTIELIKKYIPLTMLEESSEDLGTLLNLLAARRKGLLP